MANNFHQQEISVRWCIYMVILYLQGPLWRQVRGQGLAYHYNISCSVSEGLLCLRLFRATQVLQAYIVARKILVRTSNILHTLDSAAFAVDSLFCGTLFLP